MSARGEVKNHVPVSGPLDVLELLEPRLFTHPVNADAEAGDGALGDEPRLPLPFEREAVARGEAALPDCDRDVVRRIDEQVANQRKRAEKSRSIKFLEA